MDWWTLKIPNWLTVSAVLAALAIHLATASWAGLRTPVLGFLVGFVLYLPFLLLLGMGEGDLKLMAAVGSIVGPLNCIFIFVIAGLVGGLMALYISRGRLAETLANTAWILKELSQGR